MGISTRNLEGLPDIVPLRRLLQSMAMLDAILQPQRWLRYYSFNAHWSQGEMMGSMSNGSGDELFALFNTHGAFLKGFAHESLAAAIPSQHFYRGLPVQFEKCAREAAFRPDDVTFCVWRLIDQPYRSCAKVDLPVSLDASLKVPTPMALVRLATIVVASYDADGSADILSMLDGVPDTYRAWALEYYERDLPLEAIESVYQHRVLTDELVVSLNPQQRLELLNSQIVEIGYAA